MSQKTALVLGSTGLVGSSLLQLLLSDKQYGKIHLISRKPSGISDQKLAEQISPLDQMHHFTQSFQVDHLYCCLGTTIKKAKSKEAFRKVDYTYPIKAAKIAKEQGVQKLMIVTAINANKDSPFFYNQVKGEVESALNQINLPTVHIFQPSLLYGERPEWRLGEKIAGMILTTLSPFMIGSLKKYRGIQADDIAKAMKIIAHQEKKGYHVYPSNIIQQIADTHADNN